MELTKEEKAFVEERVRLYKKSSRKASVYSKLIGEIIHQFSPDPNSKEEDKTDEAWNLFKKLCRPFIPRCPHSESIRSQLARC